MSLGLTPKQRQTLDFITAFMDEHRHAPSFDEIAAGIGVKSKSGVHRLMTALEQRKAIKRGHYISRAITVLGPMGDPLEVAREHMMWAINQGMGMRQVLASILGVEPHHTSMLRAVAQVANAYEALHRD